MLPGEEKVEGGQAEKQIHPRVAGDKRSGARRRVPALGLVERQQQHAIEVLQLEERCPTFAELVQVLHATAVNRRTVDEAGVLVELHKKYNIFLKPLSLKLIN